MKRYIIGILLIFMNASFFLFSGCSKDSNANTDVVRTYQVEVYKATYSDLNQKLRYSGTVEEYEKVSAAFPVSGIVENVYVNEGEKVKKGQLLATLDSTAFKNAYRIAKATYGRAQDAINRLIPLYEKGNLSPIDMVEANTAYEQASATLEISHKNLMDCKLIADIDGVVGKRSINSGIGVAPGVAAISLIEIDSVYAVISVHEREISYLQNGTTALVAIPALGDKEWEGQVTQTGVIADPLSHTYEVKVLVNNQSHQIRPGMICNVNIINTVEQPQIVVPSQSVMIDDKGSSYVYTVNPATNESSRRYITRGEFLNEGISVSRGLAEGELVVSAGQHRLFENANVHIINSEQLSSNK